MFFKKKNDDNINSEENIDHNNCSMQNNYQLNQDNNSHKKIYNNTKIDSNYLLRDYENIRLLAMNPQNKAEIQTLISESRQDVQKIWRLINKGK